MITVRDLRVGERATLAEPAVDPQRARRLAELGLRAGESVTVLQRAVGGARVLSVAESRIAVDARTSGLLPVVRDPA